LVIDGLRAEYSLVMLTTKMKQYIAAGVVFVVAVGGFSNIVQDPIFLDVLNIVAITTLVLTVRRIRKNSINSS